MAFHSQSVNLLSKLASALGHGGRRGPRPSQRQREMEASVSVREHSGDVSGDTASSNNPAGMLTTNLNFSGLVIINMRMNQCKWHLVW